MKREFSAGGAVYKKDDGQILWLIIKPRPSKLFPTDRFQLPKGHIEIGEPIEQAALREVLEETGITAKIISQIGSVKFPMKMGEEKIFKIITYYLMEYVSGTPTENPEVEKVLWLSFPEAKKILTFQNDKSVLQKAAELLKTTNRPR